LGRECPASLPEVELSHRRSSIGETKLPRLFVPGSALRSRCGPYCPIRDSRLGQSAAMCPGHRRRGSVDISATSPALTRTFTCDPCPPFPSSLPWASPWPQNGLVCDELVTRTSAWITTLSRPSSHSGGRCAALFKFVLYSLHGYGFFGCSPTVMEVSECS